MFSHSSKSAARSPAMLAFICLILFFITRDAAARNNIRDAFFAVYPNAVGTPLDTVPSQPTHCGVCHYAFTGGGTRNPFGVLVEGALPNFPSNPNGRRQAIQSVENQDADGDGFSTLIEVTDLSTFSNTPTFPGLTPANVANVTFVDLADIQMYLTPSTGADVTPPDVIVLVPNGGETWVGNQPSTVQWFATDPSGVAGIDIDVSYDGGATYQPEARGLSNTGSYSWFPDNRPSTNAILRVYARDNAFNTGHDDSDDFFTISAPPGGIVPTTLRDFDMPGTQPFEAGILNNPEACSVCHGNYDPNVEPFSNWRGSMMSNASRDPLMQALMVVANQDAPDSGDLCLRCHFPRGWMQGRSVPTDGSQMLPTDGSGVACDLCHRLVDVIYDPQQNPSQDADILANLRFPGSWFGNGMMVLDPTGARRGPFVDATSGHPILVSPFHREAALCGTCHDVSNPAFEKDADGNYLPNEMNAPATDFSAHHIGPVERTYSEWFYSDYNTIEGVYAPQFGGNKDYVSTCQDCHMRDVTGQGCNFTTAPVRTDLPLHDMTGGSTWYPSLLPTLFPGDVDAGAIAAGVGRARYMLQNAADMVLEQEGRTLRVTIENKTGHKLPTGYPEGRRMWINVRFYDESLALIEESGAYDSATGELSHDAQAKIYEIKPGLDDLTASLVGVDPGPSFHFVLNNTVYKDNRIPPQGFSNADFASFGGPPVNYMYGDGQYWDVTQYAIPDAAVSVDVTLNYQSTSKEFVEFLRDHNTTNSKGQELYDVWSNNDKCPPEAMVTRQLSLAPQLAGDFNGDGKLTMDDYASFPDCMQGPEVSATSGCTAFDFDDDGDVDLADFAGYQEALAVFDATPPSVPTGLVAIVEDSALALQWDDNIEADLAGYSLLRSTNSSGPYLKINDALIVSSEFVDSGLSNGVTYYYVAVAVDTGGNSSGQSVEANATPEPPAPPAMHVASVVALIDDQGGGNKYGVATVTIVDELGSPVSSASVTGTFTGKFTGTLTETTDAAGVAVFTVGPKNGNVSFTFCVDNATHATYVYDPGANEVSCDSAP